MEARATQLRREIEFYRKSLQQGVLAETAQRHLAAIAQLEAELARVESPSSAGESLALKKS
jgi:hypothetical protein